MNIKQLDHFASKSEIEELLHIYNDSINQAEAERCLECNKPYYQFIFSDCDTILQLARRIKGDENLSLSYSGISVMANTNLAYHADNAKPSECIALGYPTENDDHGLADITHITWEPNHCHTRILTAVLYLNDCDTGATVFPLQRLKIYPKAGRLITFPSDHNYIHGVDNVGKNIRLTSVLWFTKD